jgi:membrane protein YdbS with pleckstrin-like domain
VWPALAHGAYRYAVREHDLLIRSGVVFRRWSAIPLARVQHVDTRQGPLERSFGLQRLLVYTASGVSADGVIPGLSEGDAHALRDALARRGPDDGV